MAANLLFLDVHYFPQTPRHSWCKTFNAWPPLCSVQLIASWGLHKEVIFLFTCILIVFIIGQITHELVCKSFDFLRLWLLCLLLECIVTSVRNVTELYQCCVTFK